MTTAKTLMTVLLLGASVVIEAQAPPATNAPEVFTASAQAKNANATASGTLEVRIRRYTPDFDRKTVEEALRTGGYPRFVTALRAAPEVGQLMLAGGQPYAIRYARERVEAGVRVILVVTDRPVLFLGSARADAKPRVGFEVAVAEIRLDPKGGTGILAAAARVRPNGEGGVLLDDYADTLIELTKIARRAS